MGAFLSGEATSFELTFLAVNVCVMAFGGMIVAAVTTSMRRTAMIAGAAIGVGALILTMAAREQQPALAEFGVWLALSIVGGAGITLGLHLLLVEAKPGFFASFGPWLRRSLATQHWSDAPPRRRAVLRRWIIAISASAGSVVGALMTKEQFWESAATAISPIGFLTLVLLAVVSILLIGPVHERIVAQGMSGEHRDEDSDDDPLLKNLSWQTAGRFAMILGVFLIMDLAYSSLEQSMKEGRLDTVYAVFYFSVTPAIVSYYWTAALQARVARVWRWTTWPATLFSSVLSIALGISVLYFGGTAMLSSAAPAQTLIILGILIAFSIAFTFVLGFVSTGLFALLGGLVIDYGRVRFVVPKLVVVLLIATLPAPLLVYIFATILEAELPISEYLGYFPPVVGWLIALRLSGFLKLLAPPEPTKLEMPTVIGA